MNHVARAEIIARLAHRGQVDKADVDYVEHLRAVAEALPSDPQALRVVAWLHDTIEDTPLSLHDLIQLGFPHVVVEAVGILTHTHEHSHADYVRAIRDAEGPAGEIARAVKRADLAHNADPARAGSLPLAYLVKRYDKAIRILDGEEP